MQIQLKQTEIVTALKQYITGQGISLAGKVVEVAFTAGRKEGGLSADISIEDLDLPDFAGEPDPGAHGVVLQMVHPDPAPEPEPEPAPEEDAMAEAEAEAVEVPAPVKTSSLFGN